MNRLWLLSFLNQIFSVFSSVSDSTVCSTIGPNEFNGAVQWSELIVVDPFHYVRKESLYERAGLINASNNFARSLHKMNKHPLSFRILYFCPSQNDGRQDFPLLEFMFALRVNFAQEEESSHLWGIPVQSNRLEFAILSFSTELKVLKIVGERLKELPISDEYLVPDKDGSTDRNKDYLKTLFVVVKILEELLTHIEDYYIPHCIASDITAVHETDFLLDYEKILERMETTLSEQYYLPPETAVYWQLSTLVKMYTSQLIVPFVNRVISSHRTSKQQAQSQFLVNQLSTYVAEEETYTSRIAVTDRQFNNHSVVAVVSNTGINISATITTSLRITFITQVNAEEEKLLNNLYGYGACSTSHLECMYYLEPKLSVPISSSKSERMKESVHCVSTKWLHSYNSIAVSPVFSLLDRVERPIYTPSGAAVEQRNYDTPMSYFLQDSSGDTQQAVNNAISYERSLAYRDIDQCSHIYSPADTPKVLIMGLAGGELHNFLLRYFPCIDVRSIDINLDMLHIAQQHTGLKHTVCNAYRLDIAQPQEGKLEPINVLDTLPISRQNGSECRSSVVIADAWEYILHQVKENERQLTKQQDPELYDLIMFDIYDIQATLWKAYPNSGVSNCFVDRAASDASLSAVRELLRPTVGIAVFHLHRDSQFEYYYNQIRKVFGSDQVVLFAVTNNDRIVVAGRNVFDSVIENSEDTTKKIKQCETSLSGITCTYVSPQEQQKPQFNLIKHPCTDPLGFVNRGSELALKWGFPEVIAKIGRFSLICSDEIE